MRIIAKGGQRSAPAQQRNIEAVVGTAAAFAGYARQRLRLPDEIMRRIESIFALMRAQG